MKSIATGLNREDQKIKRKTKYMNLYFKLYSKLRFAAVISVLYEFTFRTDTAPNFGSICFLFWGRIFVLIAPFPDHCLLVTDDSLTS